MNFDHFSLLFFILFGIAIIEIILSLKWSYFYFNSGITIFKRSIIIDSTASKPLIDIASMGKNFSKGVGPSIAFKRLNEIEIGFREKVFQFTLFSYTPIMPGRIIFDQNFKTCTIKGQTNWFAVLFPLIFLRFTFSFHSAAHGDFSDILFPVAVIVMMSLLYIIQANRFKKIADYLNRMIEIQTKHPV